MNMTPTDTTESPLLALPAEIRNRIFAFALIEDGPITAKLVEGEAEEDRAHPAPPALARVSQQTRAEAIPIFYGNNTFSFIVVQAGRAMKYLRRYNYTPRTWMDKLDNYSCEASKYLRSVKLVYCGALSNITISRSSKGDIVIEACYEAAEWIMHGRCLCDFEEVALKLVQQGGPYGSNPFMDAVMNLHDKMKRGLLRFRMHGVIEPCKKCSGRSARLTVPWDVFIRGPDARGYESSWKQQQRQDSS